jgi:DNA-binding PadR family transcriptional regulator
VEAVVSSKAALLLALRNGPGYGVDLVRRVRACTRDLVRLGRGNTYPTLRSLERAGLVRSWTIVPRERRGSRSRTYYELTIEGVVAAQAVCEAVSSLVKPASAPVTDDPSVMLKRFRDCAAVSAFTLGLQEKMSEVAP